MKNTYILDENRQPVHCDDINQWAIWMEEGARFIGRDAMERCKVCTAFMGFDLSVGLGRSVYFETMIFGPDEALLLGRYASWEEAEAGHERILALMAAIGMAGQPLTERSVLTRLYAS